MKKIVFHLLRGKEKNCSCTMILLSLISFSILAIIWKGTVENANKKHKYRNLSLYISLYPQQTDKICFKQNSEREMRQEFST